MQTPKVSEAVTVAHNLHRFGEFANPFAPLNTGPTAHVAPGYPYLVAQILNWFGDGAHGAFVIANLEALALILQISLLPLVVSAMGGNIEAGLLAGAFALLSLRRDWFWECSYLGLLLMIVILVHLKALRSRSVAIVVLEGVIWGVVFLFSPSPVLVYIAAGVQLILM
jgi:hypothetical protein